MLKTWENLWINNSYAWSQVPFISTHMSAQCYKTLWFWELKNDFQFNLSTSYLLYVLVLCFLFALSGIEEWLY